MSLSFFLFSLEMFILMVSVRWGVEPSRVMLPLLVLYFMEINYLS